MDEMHNSLRPIRREIKAETKTGEARRDHLTVFREFLAQIDKASKRKSATPAKTSRKVTRRR